MSSAFDWVMFPNMRQLLQYIFCHLFSTVMLLESSSWYKADHLVPVLQEKVSVSSKCTQYYYDKTCSLVIDTLQLLSTL